MNSHTSSQIVTEWFKKLRHLSTSSWAASPFNHKHTHLCKHIHTQPHNTELQWLQCLQYPLNDVQSKKCCMLYQSTVHPGGWLNLAEMAVVCVSLFLSTRDSFSFLHHPLLSTPFLCCLVLGSFLYILFHRQVNISINVQPRLWGWTANSWVELPGRFFFSWHWVSLTCFLMKKKNVSLCLSNFHPFFFTLYPSSWSGLVDFIQTKHNDWV